MAIICVVAFALLGLGEVCAYRVPEELAKLYYPIIYQPLKMPLGNEKKWRIGIERGKLYEYLRPEILTEIAMKRSKGEGFQSERKKLAKRPILKTEVLEVINDARKSFIDNNEQTISEKRMTETLELVDRGIADLQKLPEKIPPKRLRRVIKKLKNKLTMM